MTMLEWESVGANIFSKIRSKKMVAGFLTVVALCWTACFTEAQSPAEPVAQTPAASPSSLDFEFFKTRVEPIFLKKRPGYARCYACHSGGIGPAYLEKLSPGSTFWTDEQSRANFKKVSLFVVPGKPMSSLLLIHPLAPDAGGEIPRDGILHSGGKQFASQDDPDWQTLAEWVRGVKADAPPKQ
jgi:hypothetical protein